MDQEEGDDKKSTIFLQFSIFDRNEGMDEENGAKLSGKWFSSKFCPVLH